MEQKKQTNAQLQKRIQKAIVHVDRTKDTKEVYFTDRGLKLTINGEYAIIATGFHKHVFSRWTMTGSSKPYDYTEKVIEYAYQFNCVEKDEKGESYYSFDKLLETLKENDSTAYEYLIVYYYSMWLMNIFNPLYMIGETESATYLVFLEYCCNIAKQSILLAERDKDITNKEFTDEFIKKVIEFTLNVKEQTILRKMTDEEFAKKEMEAIQEQQDEEIIEKQIINESKNKKTE